MSNLSSRVHRLTAHQYAFVSEWQVPVDLPDAYAVLKDLWSYPHWWPVFKRAEQITSDRGAFVTRSAMPLTLNFSLVREVEDEAAGLLRARVTGDLDGIVEWHLVQIEPTLTTAHFLQRVTLEHKIARRADLLLRPLLTWNHALAMRSGHRGLTAHLLAH